MKNLIVLGIGTDVGKTITSAILAKGLQADYWKPVECGDSDSQKIYQLTKQPTIHPPTYSFKDPVSPHHAAKIRNCSIYPSKFCLPITKKWLVIESCGGLLVPFSETFFQIDLFQQWEANYLLVSRHYLGSINHTLLSLAFLKERKIPLLGIIFNGLPYAEAEQVILRYAKVPLLGRLYPEKKMNSRTIQKYAQLWRPQKWF